MKTIKYSLKGDRKMISANYEDVVSYAISKHNLNDSQGKELRSFGILGKIEINMALYDGSTYKI